MNLHIIFIASALLITRPVHGFRRFRTSNGGRVDEAFDTVENSTQTQAWRGVRRTFRKWYFAIKPPKFPRFGKAGRRRKLVTTEEPRGGKATKPRGGRDRRPPKSGKAATVSLLDVARYVYDNFFKFPYPPAPSTVSKEVSELWYARRWKAQCGVERPNHGLPNAVRKAVLIPVVAEAYNKFYVTPPLHERRRRRHKEAKGDYHTWPSRESFKFSPKVLKALQIAIMFEATGRQSEIGFKDERHLYEGFRNDSLHAFAEYAKPVLDPPVYQLVYDAFSRMYMSPNSKEAYPAQLILQRAHDLELIRCWEYKEASKKLNGMMSDLGKGPAAVTAVMSVAKYVEKMMLVTGDNVQYRPSNGRRLRWRCKAFNRNGHNASSCLDAAQKVAAPAFHDATAWEKWQESETLPLPSPPGSLPEAKGEGWILRR